MLLVHGLLALASVVELYPKEGTEFSDVFKKHSSWNDGKPANAIVVFHLEG